jgi:hypothetical protein
MQLPTFFSLDACATIFGVLDYQEAGTVGA